MTKRTSLFLFVVGLLFVAGGMFLQGTQITMAQDDEEPDPLGDPPSFLQSYYEDWVNSPHARFEDDAFQHWNEDGEIPESCATCHSTPGYLDFLGEDGSEVGVVDAPAPLGTVVNCDACHNSSTDELTTISFPSGAEITNLGDSSRCMVCHQGRSSGDNVENAIIEAGLEGEPNTVSEDLGFINIHYYAAAASIYGSEVRGGYEYEGHAYQMRTDHPGVTCAGCHDPHTLALSLDTCVECHEGADSIEAVREIRSVGSLVDYDGDGDIEEGILGELETLEAMLYDAIQLYAANVVGTPIIYSEESYPYFFIDTDGDGEVTEGEAAFPNAYNAFTPALVRATYNFQVSHKDIGGYAHNPDYHIQLMYDSIADLNEQLGEAGIDLSSASRDSFGHFQSSAEAFRHWDEDGEVSASCSRCHTSEGLPFFLEHGVTIAFEPSNSLTCTTCHNSLTELTLYPVMAVEFPSGAELSFGEDSPNNMCLTCHQGRQSGVGIQAAIDRAGVSDDEPSDALRFQNPHYFASGASLFGAQAEGAYQYPDMEYNGVFEHTRQFDECGDCHNVHSAEIQFQECADCHEGVETPEDVAQIRGVIDGERDPVDFDGDGDVEEGIASEVETFYNALREEIFVYAAETIGTPIVNAGGYPYWFIDTNGNGEADPDETNRDNAYNQWTPSLLRAIYNLQFADADAPVGEFSHNAEYMIQVLYDTLLDIGGEEAVADFTRPEVREMEE